MAIETRILIDKVNPASLDLIKDRKRYALKIEVTGRSHQELPGQLEKVQLEFFSNGVGGKFLDFERRNGSFQVVLFPDQEEFMLNYDSFKFHDTPSKTDLLEKETAYLHFNPPVFLKS